MSDDLAFSDARSLRRLLDQDAFTPRELVELFETRIERFNATSHAFITVTAEQARADADLLTADQVSDAAFTGIPFSSKDLFDVAGVRTTAGSRVFHDRVAKHDAATVARLRAAGALSIGKTNLHEFAYGATGENDVFGTSVNAYDPTRLAGGSSSGSAAALAFGLAPMALGTDTGGSVRAPAALNGLIGLKPTFGRVPTTGVFPYSWSLDHVATMTRTVADAADMLRAIAGYDADDPASLDLPSEDFGRLLMDEISGLRVGIPKSFFFDRTDPEILAAVERVTAYLERLGARLIPVELSDMAKSRTVSLTIQMPEALSAHSAFLQERGNLYGDDFRAGLALGQCILAEHYIRAKRMMELYRRQTEMVFDAVDIILTPATPEIAQKTGTVKVVRDGVEEPVGNAITRFTSFFNMTGHPAVTLPCGMHSVGVPIGVQLVGSYFQEATLLGAAAAIEREDAFSIPRPVLEH